MAVPRKRLIRPDPVAGAYTAPAIVGEVIEKRPARNRAHPHPSTGDYYRVKSERLPRLTATVPAQRGTVTHAKAVTQNLAALPEEFHRTEDEIYADLVEQGHRGAHAALSTHREMAATILAAGGTREEAADHAGVTASTVSRYLEDQEFRSRVSEVRSLILSRVQGRIVTELDRRTTKKKLKKMELMDVLRIHDRTAGPKSVGGAVSQSITVNNYDAIFAAITSPDATEEGEDFPGYGVEVIPVSGGGSQVVRKVPRAEDGAARR